jgi:hypothetical protein
MSLYTHLYKELLLAPQREQRDIKRFVQGVGGGEGLSRSMCVWGGNEELNARKPAHGAYAGSAGNAGEGMAERDSGGGGVSRSEGGGGEQEEMSGVEPRARREQVRSFLALLVQKYKY